MKNLVIIGVFIVLLLVGVVIADPGIPQVNEVQGLSTSTTVIAAGNLNAASNVDWAISSGIPLSDIPGESWAEENHGATVYKTVYAEDTQNSDFGFISYDKDLDVSTANKNFGQYNIKADKQITYLGVDASSVVTNDYMLIDGAGYPDSVAGNVICPFAGDSLYGAFCSRIETGNAVNLKVANLNTQIGHRFILESIDPGVAMCYNNIGISSYGPDLPSLGSVSSYIKGSMKESGRAGDSLGEFSGYGTLNTLYETFVFSDTTTFSGEIYSFGKGMSVKSVIDTSGGKLPME